MALNKLNRPNLSEDEIDDLLYFARIGDTEEFGNLWRELCKREGMSGDLGGLLEVARDEESGNGVLHMAAGNGHVELLHQTLKILNTPTPQTPHTLSLINTQNKSGNTPLHWAAVNGHLECVKALMEAGGDPMVRNAVGHDAIFEAEVNGRGEVVEWALKEGGEGMEAGFGGVGAEGGDVGGEEGEVEMGENEEEGEYGDGVVERKLGDLNLEDGKGKEKA